MGKLYKVEMEHIPWSLTIGFLGAYIKQIENYIELLKLDLEKTKDESIKGLILANQSTIEMVKTYRDEIIRQLADQGFSLRKHLS